MLDVRQTDEFTLWLSKLKDRAAKARIVTRIRRIELGNLGDAKSVGEGVNEARLAYGPGYRLYFMRHGERIIVLLCSGDKSTQAADIKKAKRLRKSLQ